MHDERYSMAYQIARDLLSCDITATHESLRDLDADQALAWFDCCEKDGLNGYGMKAAKGSDLLRDALEVAPYLSRRLTLSVLDNVSADDLISIRDCMRSALIDYAKDEIRYFLAQNDVLTDAYRAMRAPVEYHEPERALA